MNFRIVISVFVFFGMATLLLPCTSCERSTYQQGAFLYNKYCANCHMEEGTGLAGIIPPLAGSDYLIRAANDLPCIIRYGQQGEIRVNGVSYNQPMPGLRELSDVEITNIINYINQAWGNDGDYFPLKKTRALLKSCEEVPKLQAQ